MNRNLSILILGLAVCLAGCASLSSDPRLVGTYSAPNSESLAFTTDGQVFHSATTKGRETRFFLGYYAATRSQPLVLHFVGPDTSPFVGTSFQVSTDYSSVKATWDNFRKPKDTWQVSYQRTVTKH